MVITRRHDGVINRPVDEVRSQYYDMHYHAQTNVHPEIRFTVHSTNGTNCAYTQEISLAGLRQADEIVNTVLPDGSLQSDFVAGMNKGGRLLITFSSQGADKTRVASLLTVPVSGPKLLIAPILSIASQAALNKAFAQDKHDLESGNYTRYAGSALRS